MQLGTGATYRLYATGPVGAVVLREPYENPDPRWVFLAAVSDRDFAAFCRIAGCDGLLTDPRFASEPARRDHRGDLETILEGVFTGRSALEWESELQKAGVGCAIADGMSHFAYLYRDPQAAAIGAVVETSHPGLGGGYWRYAPVIEFSNTPSRALPYCEKGEHTREILERLGFAAKEVDGLKEAGVIIWPGADT
jgi:crotonobetainyl-CoA:carnitine CoA-transferase CaiB-like acyl-CoA transferase